MPLASFPFSTAARTACFRFKTCGDGFTVLSRITSPFTRNALIRRFRATGSRIMAEKRGGESSQTGAKYSPKVDRLQEVMSSDPTGGWERCWEEGVTPWDLGRPTPVVQHLRRKGVLPKGRALVPGCGCGHDVVALACVDRFVVGLDISYVAISIAEKLALSSPNAKYISFLKEDFFTWQPSELFDLIFDYTFFCAVEPNMRPAWGKRVAELLKPDGELVTLIFPTDDHEGGPPYKTSVSDYEKVLHPVGLRAICVVENELAVEPRQGREKLGRWRKMDQTSSL